MNITQMYLQTIGAQSLKTIIKDLYQKQDACMKITKEKKEGRGDEKDLKTIF